MIELKKLPLMLLLMQVSVASVLRTTLFNFTDFHDIGAYLLSTPNKNIIYPP